MKTPKRYLNAKLSDLPSEVTNAFAKDEKASFYLFGKIGAGKTHTAWSFAHQLDESEFRVYNVPEMLNSLRPNYEGIYGDIHLDEIINFRGHLILDDLGAEKNSEWVSEILYSIINFRYENKLSMFITSNLSIGELSQHHGDRIASRLAEMCEVVELSGEDKRIK